MSPSTAVRPLLLVLAVLGLLGTGGVEPVVRSGSTPAVSVPVVAAGTVARGAPSRRADSQAPGAVVRPGLATASTPTSGGAALAPPSAPTGAVHPEALLRHRAPAAPHLARAWSPRTGRAPPVTTGT